jgi:hypothetical protein
MLENLEPPKNAATYCKVAKVIETLQPSDQEILKAAILDSELWLANTLSNSLRSRGLSIADVTITKHRKNLCACFRD